MKLAARAKLLLLIAGFALPIAASYFAYYFMHVEATSNYGELLLPPGRPPREAFDRPQGAPWTFDELRGRWALAASDSGGCPAACREKLTTMRQVQLALGRNASRVARVYVVDDVVRPDSKALEPYAGMLVALTPTGTHLPPGVANDRAHIYLVDPNGNVMMRWPAAADRKRMLRDLERLLKASQIG
jgi:cytochrome oxidase Cu insertion factor (SCO1/SenC/PrrC family)